MKRRKYVKLTSIISIFGLSGCLGYFDTSKKYEKMINQGNDANVRNTSIDSDNLNLKVQNTLNIETRATIVVRFYDSNGDIIQNPSVYSTDPIPANSYINHSIPLYNKSEINSYELNVTLNQ